VTQAALAEALGVSQARISKIEHGEISGIDIVRTYVAGLGGRDRPGWRPELEGSLTRPVTAGLACAARARPVLGGFAAGPSAPAPPGMQVRLPIAAPVAAAMRSPGIQEHQ
jgi:transcriptional regulator with XRE-family HTH domain